jgi:hypothetical protein
MSASYPATDRELCRAYRLYSHTMADVPIVIQRHTGFQAGPYESEFEWTSSP